MVDAREAESGVASRVPVLDPDGRFRSLWNVLMAFLICWCAVVVPLEIGYDTALRASLGADGLSAWNTLNHFFDFVFIADIILNFRTGFTYEGQLVTNGRRIADHYIRDSFFIDLIGSFPFNLIVEWSAQEDADPSSRLNRQLRMRLNSSTSSGTKLLFEFSGEGTKLQKEDWGNRFP